MSFDCASKSLAYFHATFDLDVYRKIGQIGQSNEIGEESAIDILRGIAPKMKNFVEVHAAGVIDTLQGQPFEKSTEISRTLALKSALDGANFQMTPDTLVLVEKQPPTKNTPSTGIMYQLLLYFAAYKLEIISPRKKLQICFSGELEYGNFVAKYSRSYEANKAHSKANFLYFLRIFGMEYIISGVKKKNYDDLADAFMQCIAYIRFNILSGSKN